MTKRSKPAPVGATEFLSELQRDPEHQRMVLAAEAERLERERQLDEAERPIVAELGEVGVQVTSVWDLVNTSDPYPAALPVLMDHLERGGYPELVMQGLGRALGVRPAVVFWDRLKMCWLHARGPGEEDGAAVALAACATKKQFEDLVEFLSVAERGDCRIHFVRSIARVGGERGYEVLASVADDPVLGQAATARLKRRRR